MVKQYPYILKVLQHQEATFDQRTGSWVGGEAQWVELGKCRDEINGSGAKITTEDSENYVYSAVVYAPKNTPTIGKGAKIQVWDKNTLRLEGNVTRFSRDQLHSRIWL